MAFLPDVQILISPAGSTLHISNGLKPKHLHTPDTFPAAVSVVFFCMFSKSPEGMFFSFY